MPRTATSSSSSFGWPHRPIPEAIPGASSDTEPSCCTRKRASPRGWPRLSRRRCSSPESRLAVGNVSVRSRASWRSRPDGRRSLLAGVILGEEQDPGNEQQDGEQGQEALSTSGRPPTTRSRRCCSRPLGAARLPRLPAAVPRRIAQGTRRSTKRTRPPVGRGSRHLNVPVRPTRSVRCRTAPGCGTHRPDCSGQGVPHQLSWRRGRARRADAVGLTADRPLPRRDGTRDPVRRQDMRPSGCRGNRWRA